MGSLEEEPLGPVAVIGAGPAGVTSAKALLGESAIRHIDIFEQRGSFGGAWNYIPSDYLDPIPVPQTSPCQVLESPKWSNKKSSAVNGLDAAGPIFSTPMYDDLETNIPSSLMSHSHDPSLNQSQLFPTQENALAYFKRCAASIRHLVRFNTQVQQVTRRTGRGRDIWRVQVCNVIDGTIDSREYSAVIVCTGHYHVPSIPDIPGLKAWNEAHPGSIQHAKHFRGVEKYKGKKVIVVGNAASGTDIARRLSAVAQLPILSSERSESMFAYSADWKRSVPLIAEFLPNTQGSCCVRFTDGAVEEDVDMILFCTGYYYSLPFLTSLDPPLIRSGDRVEHLYQHMFYIPHPSLCFMGLPINILPPRTFEAQAAVISRVIAARLDLPQADRMEAWEKNLLAEVGSERGFHGMRNMKDFAYHRELLDWAAKARDESSHTLPPYWSAEETWQRKRFAEIRRSFVAAGAKRHQIHKLEELGYNYSAWVKEHPDEA